MGLKVNGQTVSPLQPVESVAICHFAHAESVHQFMPQMAKTKDPKENTHSQPRPRLAKEIGNQLFRVAVAAPDRAWTERHTVTPKHPATVSNPAQHSK